MGTIIDEINEKIEKWRDLDEALWKEIAERGQLDGETYEGWRCRYYDDAIEIHGGEKDKVVILAVPEAVRVAEFIIGLCTEAENTPRPSSGVLAEISVERAHQIVGGFSAGRDDAQRDGQLIRTAAAYSLSTITPSASEIVVNKSRVDGVVKNTLMHPRRIAEAFWSGADLFPRPCPRRDLIRATALLVAEIERRDRAQAKGGQ